MSPFGSTASALAPPTSAPTADHTVPFHRITLDGLLPALASRSPFAASANADASPARPPPSGDHAVPFQRAMLFTGTPPATSNAPAATTSPFANSSTVFTEKFVPVPSGCQV